MKGEKNLIQSALQSENKFTFRGKSVIWIRNLIMLPVIILLTNLNVKAQDPEFSQFYANPLYMNPAFAGTSEFPRVVTNYRNQWPNNGNTFVTYNLTYDNYVKSMKGGLGFQMLYDRELNGVVNSVNSAFFYSYHIKAGDQLFFTGALQAGFIFKQFNTSGLIFPGMIDQGTGNITDYYPLPVEDGQKIVPDFSFGMAGQSKDVYFGLALHHLTQPNLSIVEGDQVGRLPMKATLHAGAKLHRFHNLLFSRDFTLSPNFVYQQQGSFKQLNFGMYMIEKWVTFGGWYRNNLSVRPDAVIAMVGYTGPKFQLGYSFDFSLSNVANYSYGSHELSLIFFFGENSHRGLFNETMRIPSM
jgi:type IX secretion system PorP/SprF family membrane protein